MKQLICIALICVIGCSSPSPESGLLPAGSMAYVYQDGRKEELIAILPDRAEVIPNGTSVLVLKDPGPDDIDIRIVEVSVKDGPAAGAKTGISRRDLRPVAR